MNNKMNHPLITVDGRTLMDRPLEPPNFVVDTLISQGLHILAGSPKVGKSWLALWLAVTVAKGEPVWNMTTRQGTTLYLCLEDSVLRIQNRLFEITEDAPDSVHFCTECALIGQGLEEQVDAFIAAHPDWVCPMPANEVLPDCGSICALLTAASGVEPVFIGKPNRNMVDIISEQTGVPNENICCVGDRLYTDIAVAQNAGAVSVCVLSGESSMEDIEKAERKPDYVLKNVAEIADILKANM